MPYEEKIVSNIEQMVGGDGQPLWVTYFEGKKLTFSEKTEPTWKKGEQLPFKVKVVNPPGKPWYYMRSEDTGATANVKPPQTQKKEGKSYTADPQKIESIEYQNSRNVAVQLYCHVTEPGTPFDRDMLMEVFRACQALGADVVDVAKKAYGAVEK